MSGWSEENKIHHEPYFILLLFYGTIIIDSVYTEDKFEYNKGVIRICISKGKTFIGQMKTEKMTNDDIQNIAQKKTFIHKNTTTRAAETPLFIDWDKRN